jgi:hypothetical protein
LKIQIFHYQQTARPPICCPYYTTYLPINLLCEYSIFLISKYTIKTRTLVSLCRSFSLFSLGHGKGERVDRSLEIKQFEKNDPFPMYFVPNTAYSCDSLQFLPTPLPKLIDT